VCLRPDRPNSMEIMTDCEGETLTFTVVLHGVLMT
jgi:hypothetical protein